MVHVRDQVRFMIGGLQRVQREVSIFELRSLSEPPQCLFMIKKPDMKLPKKHYVYNLKLNKFYLKINHKQ